MLNLNLHSEVRWDYKDAKSRTQIDWFYVKQDPVSGEKNKKHQEIHIYMEFIQENMLV